MNGQIHTMVYRYWSSVFPRLTCAPDSMPSLAVQTEIPIPTLDTMLYIFFEGYRNKGPLKISRAKVPRQVSTLRNSTAIRDFFLRNVPSREGIPLQSLEEEFKKEFGSTTSVRIAARGFPEIFQVTAIFAKAKSWGSGQVTMTTLDEVTGKRKKTAFVWVECIRRADAREPWRVPSLRPMRAKEDQIMELGLVAEEKTITEASLTYDGVLVVCVETPQVIRDVDLPRFGVVFVHKGSVFSATGRVGRSTKKDEVEMKAIEMSLEQVAEKVKEADCVKVLSNCPVIPMSRPISGSEFHSFGVWVPIVIRKSKVRFSFEPYARQDSTHCREFSDLVYGRGFSPKDYKSLKSLLEKSPTFSRMQIT